MKKQKVKDTLDLLKERSILKQEVYKITIEKYHLFKNVIDKEIKSYKHEINDDRVRLKFDNNGDFETHAYVGSDVLVFNMHTNVFTFPENNRIWKNSYIEEDKQRGYFGIIHIYNFLAESFLQNRMNDIGGLVGRIFVNKDNHFMIEGSGDLGILYRNLRTNEFNEEAMQSLFACAVRHVAQFDLQAPPFQLVSTVNVMQIKSQSSIQEIKMGKKLGFKPEYLAE